MSAVGLKESQMQMARFLRDPETQTPPPGVEGRRLKIYQELIYNNIEGFISGGFPVLRSLYSDSDWHSLVRLFIDTHRCHTPYFLEISQEFVRFLMEEHNPGEADPPFIAELAHYEWVELALDVAEAEPPECKSDAALLDAVPSLSPLAWVLSYTFPVHRIGPSYRPCAPEHPTYLAVFRARDECVGFIELNAATARLLELIRDNDTDNCRQLLGTLARELGMDVEQIIEFGAQQLQEFSHQSVIGLR